MVLVLVVQVVVLPVAAVAAVAVVIVHPLHRILLCSMLSTLLLLRSRLAHWVRCDNPK